jgi:hypothetical protein
MKYEDKFNGKHFDVGTGTSISINEIKGLVDKHQKAKWHHGPSRVGDARHTRANTSELENIGWKAKINSKLVIEECFKENNNE